MRIALLSDIHGNAMALDAVLAHVAKHGPFDQLVVAGDLVWAGPWPAEVVDRLRAAQAVVVQGNTDAFFGRTSDDTPLGKQEERFAAHLAWMHERLGPERIAYLANLPFSHRISPAVGRDLLVVHANPIDQGRPITSTISQAALDALLLEHSDRDGWAALAFGHVHTPFILRWRKCLLVNVASAGLSMDGDPRAAYAVLSWDGRRWSAEHHRVPYDIQAVARQMRTGGLPRGKHFAERLMSAGYQPRGSAMAAGR